MKKLLSVLFFIVFTSQLFATNNIYLAVNFKNNNIPEKNIKKVFSERKFDILKIHKQNEIGFRVIEGNFNGDIIKFCQTLRKDNIVDMVQQILSPTDCTINIKQQYYVKKNNAKLSLFFLGKEMNSVLVELLEKTSDYATAMAIADVLMRNMDEDYADYIIKQIKSANVNALNKMVYTNMLASIHCDKSTNYFLSMLKNPGIPDELKINYLFLLDINENTKALFKKYYSSSKNSKLKTISAYKLAEYYNKNNHIDLMSDLRKYFINKFKDMEKFNASDFREIYINALGIVGNEKDLLLLKSIKEKLYKTTKYAISCAIAKIKYKNLSKNQKSDYLKKIVESDKNYYKDIYSYENQMLIIWAYSELSRLKTKEALKIIKNNLLNYVIWTSSPEINANRAYMTGGAHNLAIYDILWILKKQNIKL